MTKTSKKTKKEMTEVTPQTLEIEKEAPVVMEDATNPNTAVIDETPAIDEVSITEEPTIETPEEEILETTAEELCPEEEAPEDKQEEEPMPESPEETPEEKEVVEEPIAEEVKETPKAPQPHKLGRQFTYYWNGISY